jgi:hypothetical protein
MGQIAYTFALTQLWDDSDKWYSALLTAAVQLSVQKSEPVELSQFSNYRLG